jgi:hypothetical protein
MFRMLSNLAWSKIIKTKLFEGHVVIGWDYTTCTNNKLRKYLAEDSCIDNIY